MTNEQAPPSVSKGGECSAAPAALSYAREAGENKKEDLIMCNASGPEGSRLAQRDLSNQDYEERLKSLFLIPSPYDIKEGIRFKRGTNILVSDSLNFICIDIKTNKIINYSSLSECSLDLKLNRSKIKNSLLTGEQYKHYKFIFSSALK